MDTAKLTEEYAKFQQKNADFEGLVVLSRDGNILQEIGTKFINADEAKKLLEAWLKTQPAIEVGGARYPILKWDELQFAARNTSGKGALAGCICKSKVFVVSHISPASKTNLIQNTITLNRWSFSLID